MRVGTPRQPRTQHAPAAKPRPKPPATPAAKAPRARDRFDAAPKLGGGNPSVDFNGTKYTALEGRAADTHLSIDSKRHFDPLTERGIALTSSQARQLGVKVGDAVSVRDTVTGKTVSATFYDSAGTKPDGLKHFEVSPALADALGISYRNRRGEVVDAVTNPGSLRGRFAIEKAG